MVTPKHVKLPFETKPLLNHYHYIAFPMGIIQANAKEDITPWLCGRYVNCVFNPDPYQNNIEISLFDRWGTADKILDGQNISLFNETYKLLEIDLISLLKSCLSNNFYIGGQFNERYLPGRAAYEQYDYIHDYILFGYSDDKQVFYSAGYLNGIYGEIEIPYIHMKNSLVAIAGRKLPIDIWSYNPNAKYTLNMHRLIKDWDDYVNSINSRKLYSYGKTYGIVAMKNLKVLLENQVTHSADEPYIDIRYTKALMEHKYLMLLRLKYLSKNGYCEFSDIAREYENIYNNAVRIHLLGLKILNTKKAQYISGITKFFNEIIEFEEHYFPKVVQILKEKTNFVIS